MPKRYRQLCMKDLPYVVAREGFEPAIFRTQGTEPTAVPPWPTKENISLSKLKDTVTTKKRAEAQFGKASYVEFILSLQVY